MNKEVKFSEPISFHYSTDVLEPDIYINEIEKISQLSKERHAEIQAIKKLNRKGKARWLLSLPDIDKAIGCAGYLIIVTVYICTMVIIGYTAAGLPIKKKKCVPKKKKKCVPK